MKTTVFRKHVHSSNASFSSGDSLLYFETKEKLDFNPENLLSITSKKFPTINGQGIKEVNKDKGFVVVYLCADEKFQYGRLGDSHEDDPAFKALVQSYLDKGFSNTQPQSLKDFFSREKVKYNEKQRKAGIVLWMDFETFYHNPEYYQGGFSDELFKNEKLQAYIKGGAHGWIGHSEGRKAWHDTLIEAGLKERGLSPEIMRSWITSGSGRHFADSLEGFTKKEQTEKIKRNLNDMFNSCLIYNAPEHKGKYTDTVSINKKFQDLDLLLPFNTKKFNKKQYAKNLCKLIGTIYSKEQLDIMDNYIMELVKDIYANLASC